MVESETTIHVGATKGALVSSRVCRQLVDNPGRYSLWHVSHDKRMTTVAERSKRDRQILALRAVHLEQVHRTALVLYLRKSEINGVERDRTLQEFYGLIDLRSAAVTEHRTFLISASTLLCTYRLLKLVGDTRGLALLRDYHESYQQFFAMFCDNARSAQDGSTFLLRWLIPDARAEAAALRKRILGGDGLPSQPVAVKLNVEEPAMRKMVGSCW